MENAVDTSTKMSATRITSSGTTTTTTTNREVGFQPTSLAVHGLRIDIHPYSVVF
jgi:hypothetical protein